MVSAAPSSKAITVPLAIFDFVLRLVFFSFAPALIVAVWFLIPITGALVNIGLALGVFFAGEWVRRMSTKSRLVKLALGQQLVFEEYYRSRAPRPFLYYVFYPLMLPYVIFDRNARREFLLFKGYTLMGFAVLIGMSVFTYYRNWHPELPLAKYLPTLLVTLAVESIAVLMLMMPLATTVVTYHIHRSRWRLVALLAAGAVSIGAVTAIIVHRRDPIVSYETRRRLELRTAEMPDAAHEAQVEALEAAWKYVRENPEVVQQDGKVIGEALDVARAILDKKVYKTDESFAFDLYAYPQRRPDGIILYYKPTRGKKVYWVGLNRAGHEIKHKKELAPDLLARLSDLYGE
jgi:hypothetical protein